VTNFIIIFLSILAGILIQKFKELPPNSHKVVNIWVISVALPSISLRYIPKMQWNSDLLFIMLVPPLIYITAFVLIEILGKFKTLDRKTKACLALTVGLSNLSFLGFPLTEAYYGKEGLQLAILCDQAGFMTVSTLGILTATHASGSGQPFSISNLLKKLFSFPPTIAFILAFSLPKLMDYSLIESTLDPIFESLGATMVPMALFSVGLQLQFKEWKADKSILFYALNYKLVLAPLLILGISILFTIEKLYSQVGIIEAAMAPMVTGTIIASEFNLRPKLSTMILSFGIILSFLTTYLWYLILG